MGKGADVAVHKALEAAEHLPASLEQLPGGAAAVAARAEAARQVAKEKVGGRVRRMCKRGWGRAKSSRNAWGVVWRRSAGSPKERAHRACAPLPFLPPPQAERGLASLAGLGSKLVLGTHDLFEQIRHAARSACSTRSAPRHRYSDPAALLPLSLLQLQTFPCTSAVRSAAAHPAPVRSACPALCPRPAPAAATRCRTRWRWWRARAPTAARRPRAWAASRPGTAGGRGGAVGRAADVHVASVCVASAARRRTLRCAAAHHMPTPRRATLRLFPSQV